jgi:type II secretory pathway component GspD/PulD (secretin)
MQRSLSITARSLVVLASLLPAQRALARDPQSINIQGAAAQAAEDRILAILETSFSPGTRNTSLREVLAGITRSSGLPIHIDTKVLDEASVSPDAPVTCDFSAVSLHAALDMILDQLDLGWVIHDECVLVTTPDKAGNVLINKVYPAQDLVTFRNSTNQLVTNYQPLVQMITDTIAPTTWDEVGGSGAIAPFGPSGSIVVSQRREVHEEIAKLLTALRQARDVQSINPYVDRGGASAGRHARRHTRQPRPIEPAEPSRYVVTPSLGWALPQLHE